MQIIVINLFISNTFISNKSFSQVLDISLKNFVFWKTFDSEFSYIEVWFTDQKFNPLDSRDRT